MSRAGHAIQAILVATASIALTACGSSDGALLDLAHGAVAKELKDPDSAKFSGEYLADFPEPSTKFSQLRTACGEVNAKNAFGAFAGPVRYVVLLGVPSGASKHIALSVDLEKSPRDPIFTASFWQNCSKK